MSEKRGSSMTPRHCERSDAISLRLASILLVVFSLLSCGRNTDFLYHYNQKPKQRFSFEHSLKEMQGDSRVDILWVIDNSGSMGQHQQALITNTENFIDLFSKKGGLDWKMGLISTSEGQSPFAGFTTALTFKTPNAIDIFKRSVRKLGTDGDMTEKTFRPVMDHLTQNPSFARKGVTLIEIFITDAPEQSRIPASDFLKFMAQIKGDLQKVITYGIFSSRDFGCQFTDGVWNYAGSPYEEVIKATKGKVFSLCSGNFGAELIKLGNDLMSRVDHPFIQLKNRPRPNTIKVHHENKELKGGPQDNEGKWIYEFDLNRIIFYDLEFAKKDIEKVTISYEEA
jgi:hypothetical protein